MDTENRPQLTEKEIERGQLVKEKREDGAFQVAFCGHFSAGKSTILNHLLGAEMLPTSPIPTSANVIGIKNGELGLTVNMIGGGNKKWEGEIPWERVREWGMNGGEIDSLMIEAPLPFLGSDSIIYDTPGVDSTDPSHQAVTLEALYTTDFIVYVMDYNHVQSETNLTFLKQLSDEKKPLYLVVNQIDKHNEKELSFAAFDESIRDTLDSCGINILYLRYTSMKFQDHHLSQVNEFETEMKAMLYHGHELLPYAKQRLQQGYYLSIVHRLNGDAEDEIEDIKEEVQQKGFRIEQLEERELVEQDYERSMHASRSFQEKMETDIQKITKDVTIFPYTTTELARLWLESADPGFKVGLLFSKKKTEEERTLRVERLIAETNDKIKSQLLFHLFRLFQEHDFTLLSNREQVEQAIDQLQFSVDASFFQGAVQPGPKSREYVYTFTKERTAAIVRELRRKASSIVNLMSQGMEEHWKEEQTRLANERNHLHELGLYIDEIKAVEKKYEALMDDYNEKASRFQDAGGYERNILEFMKKEIPDFGPSSLISSISLPTESVIDTEWNQAASRAAIQFDHEKAINWTNELTKMLSKYDDDERMQVERKVVKSRTEKFQQQTYTVSLFGAFSAGKSSFANALLGDHILPVSPHPTTATVNTVKKSEPGHPSRTAVVQVKTKEQLDTEINTISKQLDLDLTIETLSAWKPDTKNVMTSWQKTYQAYLLTLKNSLNETTWEMGSQLEVGLEELQPFVANEHDACLIDEVTLFYDCPITEKGIILVDTPGVNSIHGRHTNVAFKQLRDSDAIFYLSYYNHAFSKADQSFLQQMAKVNEGFRSDKLYFILNAADLANSEFELNGVRKHVYDQLISCGIEEPRLYPLSSKKGLEGKQRGEAVDPLFNQFEKAFYEQTIGELEQLSFDLLVNEVNQYEAVLSKGIEYITEESSEKDARRAKLVKEVEEKIAMIGDLKPLTAYQMAVQEVSQLFLYLRERVRYVIGDNFQDSVNVTTVVGANKRAQQQALLHALKEWRSEGEHFLQQEIQATLVRVEVALSQSITEWVGEMVKDIRAAFPAYSISYELLKKELALPIPDRLIPLQLEAYTTTFQSLKAFFEQQQVKKLKEELVDKATESAGYHLKEVEALTLTKLDEVFEQIIEDAKNRLIQSLTREVERFDSLMDPRHHDSLKKEFEDIHEVLADLN